MRGKPEQEPQRDRRAQDFGQIAGRDGDLAQHPQRIADAARIRFAAGLRQIASGDDPQAGGQGLQQNRHQVRHHQHPQKPVAEAGAAFEVGGPVAGVHVADAHQVGWAGERQHAAKHGGVRGQNAPVNFREGGAR